MRRWQFFLATILLIALFFRIYKLEAWLGFDHDADLYSWIVKDIVVDGHWRLIGQLTSTEGVFIGPFFYYLLAPFFLLTNLDPIGAAILVAIMGVVTTASYFLVFGSILGKRIGLIAALWYAVLYGTVFADRWVVPTVTTNLWSVWFLLVIYRISQGKHQMLPFAAVLVALIWQVHLALAPLIILVPIAILMSRKLPSLAASFQALALLIIFSLPLIIFEWRHGFIQTISIINSLVVDQGGSSGLGKFWQVVTTAGANSSQMILSSRPLPDAVVPIVLIFSAVFAYFNKIINRQLLVLLTVWVVVMIGFFSFNSKPLSEYYLANMTVVYLAAALLMMELFFKIGGKGAIVAYAFVGLIVAWNGFLLLTRPASSLGYLQKKQTVEFIGRDAGRRNFPCVSVAYITNPGMDVGFRYLFWRSRLVVNQPGSGSPIYTIVIPWIYSQGSVEAVFGLIGVIPPKTEQVSAQDLKKACQDRHDNITGPMLGFVK